MVAVISTGSLAQSTGFGAQLNPTGNPIGGGPGYTNILSAADADYVVSNKSEFLAALASATRGQIIYVMDNAVIDLTDQKNLPLPAGVTVASGRGRNGSWGALLYSNAMYPPGELAATFVTGGTDVRLTGLRMKGPTGNIGDHEFSNTGVSNALRTNHAHYEVDNCEFFGWDKWALYLYITNGAYVHHNYIHHSLRTGFGYGVWLGGAGAEVGGYALVEANVFEFNRHQVASSGHPNSWEIRHNVFLPHAMQHNVDRHGYGSTGATAPGGLDSHLHHNLFLDTNTPHFSSPIPLDGGETRIHNNWSALADECLAARICANHDHPAVFAYDNQYGGAGVILPSARILASTLDGTAPLTVSFDGSASTDNEGGSINWYQWDFADGDYTGNEARGQTVEYTFSEPGVYPVELTVFNDRGIPGFTTVPITVRPPAGGHYLSGWVADTYWGNKTGYYKKQVLVDGTVVWEDDAAGNDGWQHVVADISPYVSPNTTATIAFRLYVNRGVTDPTNEISEIRFYVDDVHVFGGNVRDPGFEDESNYWRARAGGDSFGSLWVSENTRSGVRAYQTRKGYMKTSVTGSWSEIYQSVAIGEAEGGGTSQSNFRLDLPDGWSTASTLVWPSPSEVSTIFSPVNSSLVAVKAENGDIYAPQFNIDTIGQWDALQAYHVKMVADAAVTFQGSPIDPAATPLSVRAGWNLVPFFTSSAKPVEEALSTILGDLVVVKGNGDEIYYPEFGIQTLTTMYPGRGYKLYVSRAGSLVYPAQ